MRGTTVRAGRPALRQLTESPHQHHSMLSPRSANRRRSLYTLRASNTDASERLANREVAAGGVEVASRQSLAPAQAKVQALEDQVHVLTSRLKELEMERAHNTAQLDLLAKCVLGLWSGSGLRLARGLG